MRARLGPEAWEARSPVATSWETYPDPMVTLWCRTFFRTVTHGHPYGVERSIAPRGTTSWEKPPKRATHWLHQQKADDMLSTFYSHIIITSPKGIPRA
ncbi:hypothetical protein CK203_059888 [Vitis vinifera]|uniref:Uncharacterized protein n=1 Tax=Vitis vinifera TaxID=29760 RepID=A0A438GUA7_VITVI|nr:hypothetical protein CK203_059888 [Vitis vinifera]